ncbi:pupal cuticle protein Edg-84A-like [Musca vetustissima]|uniref:pupal cuticle protein Edg-84A-like n=1 Tax=Musca vetustissima TaxID=27455 RepID=UPI002AB66B19|nr:pupal cuticle protein Edg-84A-like [Musca vetustissima]
MQFKFVILLASIAFVSAGLLPENFEQNDPHANYEFSYSVDDQESGDVKTQLENRDGDSVQGQYTLNDADGYKRIVDYSVNGDSGFRATVRRERLDDAETYTKQSIEKPAAEVKENLVKPVVPAKPLVQKPVVQKPLVQTPGYLRTTVVHQPAIYHAPAPVVHLTPSTHHHIVHAAPATTVLKSTPTVITTTTHHHTPAVVHHHAPAVVRAAVVHHAPATAVVHHHTPAVATPHHHVSYVHYH